MYNLTTEQRNFLKDKLIPFLVVNSERKMVINGYAWSFDKLARIIELNVLSSDSYLDFNHDSRLAIQKESLNQLRELYINSNLK